MRAVWSGTLESLLENWNIYGNRVMSSVENESNLSLHIFVFSGGGGMSLLGGWLRFSVLVEANAWKIMGTYESAPQLCAQY